MLAAYNKWAPITAEFQARLQKNSETLARSRQEYYRQVMKNRAKIMNEQGQ
jgi:hypothetical protein